MKNPGLYYPELDGLRFLAFLLVLIHHSPFAEQIRAWEIMHEYGWVGVDLFLCLSAFMFARLLFAERQLKGNINIVHFYVRRALRIWPLYFAFLGLSLLYSIHKNGWSIGMLYRSIGMLTFTDNLLSMSLGYNLLIEYSGHLWTISYEEQFYFAIPWALRYLYGLRKTTTLAVLSAAMLLGMIVRAVFIYYEIEHPAIWVFPFSHFESIFGGLVIGLGLVDQYLKRIPGWALFLGGLIALYLITMLPNVNLIQWGLMLTYPLVGIGTSLIIFAIMQEGLGPIPVVLRNKRLRYLGKISYGLYVYHFATEPAAVVITNIFFSRGRSVVYPCVLLIITRLILTILISALSYQLLEKPFLRLKNHFTLVASRPI